MVEGHRIIAVCVTDIQHEDIQSLIYPFHKYVTACGWSDIIFSTCTDLYDDNAFNSGEASVFELLDCDCIDAVVVMGHVIKNEQIIENIIRKAALCNRPVVVVDENDKQRKGCINISFDEENAFYQIVNHLVKKHGFRKINCIAGFKGNPISEKRLEVFRQVMSENDIPFDEEQLGYGDFYSFPTKNVMESFLSDEDDRPEAIVCINDAMAITACEVIFNHGLNVPQDIAVTGFDGIEQEKYNFPRITTCRRDLDKFAKFLYDIINKALSGQQMNKVYKFPYTPDYSESCGCKPISVTNVSKSINTLYNRMNDSAAYDRSMNNMVTRLTVAQSPDEIRQILKHYIQFNSYICMNSDFDEVSMFKFSGRTEPFTDNVVFNRFFYETHSVKHGLFDRRNIFPEWNSVINRDDPPVIFPIHNQCSVYGYMIAYAVDYSFSDFSRSLMLMQRFAVSLDTCISAYVQRNYLQESNTRLKDIQNEIIISFADMVESRDNCTGEHIKRTGEYLNVLVRKMAEVPEYKDQLTDDTIELMCKAAPLHDIGKIKISDNILNKPARLTPDEFDIIKTHTNSGSEIILRSLINIEDADYLDIAVKMALYHHEKWDGSGYPCHLAGKNIPLCARVMAVVDVFDALTSKRVYKEAYTIDKALEIMLESKGTHFDPDIIDIFISIRSDIEKIYYNIR